MVRHFNNWMVSGITSGEHQYMLTIINALNKLELSAWALNMNLLLVGSSSGLNNEQHLLIIPFSLAMISVFLSFSKAAAIDNQTGYRLYSFPELKVV